MEYREAEKLATRMLEMAPGNGPRQRDLMFVKQKIGDVHQMEGNWKGCT